MKKIVYYILFMVFIGATSCEDFLDKAPVHNLTIENAVTDYNGAKNILNGMYSTIQVQSWGGKLFVRLSAQGGFYDGHSDNYNMNYSQGVNDHADVWKDFYKGINAANSAITALSNLADEKYPSPETKQKMIAEARCYRAWVNTHLLWLFSHWWAENESPYGILFRDKMANLSNLQNKRLSVGESYTKIFEDLDFAIKNLDDFSSSRFLSKQMAQIIKAKILLYRGKGEDYKNALDLVLDVKTNAPSKFQMEGDLATMYKNSWDSNEVLWARFLEDTGWRTYSEFEYSYGIIYTNKYHENAENWLENDPRYNVIMEEVKAPETWDDRMLLAPKKLCHNGRANGPNDKYATYYFRYAELYLMEAELKARISPTKITEALAPLNEMRSKRTNPVLPALSANNTEELMDVIFKEIWTELCLENGSEYFAALRFQKDSKPWIYTLKSDVNFSENKFCWPIPDIEMVNNKLMEQNPELK